jgi:hypothetical protein
MGAMKSGVQIFEEDSKILEAIAAHYDEGSREHTALVHAALALLYVMTTGKQKFMEHIVAPESGLTADQKRSLMEMGVDPDSEPITE